MPCATNKRWALCAIIIALSASSLAAGLFFLTKLGALDRRYSEAMERHPQAVFLARDLARNTAEAHRSLVNLAVEKLALDPASRRAPGKEATFQIRTFSQMHAANDRLFTDLEPLTGNAQDCFADAILDPTKATTPMLSTESRCWQRVSVGLPSWPFALATFLIAALSSTWVSVLRDEQDEAAE